MASKHSTTIDEYIEVAPPEGRPHLRRVYAILKSVALDAEETIKWGTPFFVEPRFLFSFSAHKAPKNYLQLPYDQPVPEELVRKIAQHCVKAVRERKDDAFW